MFNMRKSTMSTKMQRKLKLKMQIVCEQIRLARLRRNLSATQIAERTTCFSLTVSRIEKGAPTVSIGIYLQRHYKFKLEDVIGKALQNLSLKKREMISEEGKL